MTRGAGLRLLNTALDTFRLIHLFSVRSVIFLRILVFGVFLKQHFPSLSLKSIAVVLPLLVSKDLKKSTKWKKKQIPHLNEIKSNMLGGSTSAWKIAENHFNTANYGSLYHGDRVNACQYERIK